MTRNYQIREVKLEREVQGLKYVSSVHITMNITNIYLYVYLTVYPLQCVGYWKENLKSYLITYDQLDAFTKYRCWVYQR